jgi:Cu-processing system permease protein
MLKKFRLIGSLAWLIILDGLRRNALLGLFLFALACETGGLLFFDFIPRDIGRASNDFLFSISWFTGFIFLLFHAVHVAAWDDERRTIHTLLARPISRAVYVIGVFVGLAFLLFTLNCILGATGWLILNLICKSVQQYYFQNLSFTSYLLAWGGLFCIELVLLSVIMVFSGSVRGGFPVLLLTLSYYLICSGLPVVRQAVQQKTIGTAEQSLSTFLKALTAIFPDFTQLDFKTLAASSDLAPAASQIALPFLVSGVYCMIALWLACAIYQQRDLQ